MIENWIFISVAIFGVFAGTFTDLKARWSPDWVSYLMIAFGLGGHAIISVFQNNFWPVLYSITAFAIMFCIAAAMFYTGIFAGGDAKMLMGLGALLPIAPEFVKSASWPFFITILLNILIIATIIGILTAFYLAIKHYKKFREEFKHEISKNKLVIYSASIAMLFIPIIARYANYNLILFTGILAYVFLILVFVLKATEKTCMFKYISPSKLVEGDWIAEPVNVGEYSFKPKRTGIEKRDIEKLKEFENLGKLKEVKVKEGLPMIPSFLIALIISIVYGDLISLLIGSLM